MVHLSQASSNQWTHILLTIRANITVYAHESQTKFSSLQQFDRSLPLSQLFKSEFLLKKIGSQKKLDDREMEIRLVFKKAEIVRHPELLMFYGLLTWRCYTSSRQGILTQNWTMTQTTNLMPVFLSDQRERGPWKSQWCLPERPDQIKIRVALCLIVLWMPQRSI